MDTPTLAALRKTADFVLSLQDRNGMIADASGAAICNLDSNMEYALMGLAAAYQTTHDPRYLRGLERGISWLAARMEMTDPQFKGSFHYAYSTTPPYAPVAISPGGSVTDVRGVDATSALFVHLLARHAEVTGTRTLADKYAPQAHAALHFLLEENRASDGFFYSSWQKQDGRWQLWKYEYAADQGDVYLGFRAGADLYEGANAAAYTATAHFLLSKTAAVFYDAPAHRFGTGRSDGVLDGLDGVDGVFPQGYLPWVFGANPQAQAAYQWLAQGVTSTGSLSLFPGDAQYALSAEVFALAATALGKLPANASLHWLQTALTDASGGIRDSLQDSAMTSNIAGFAVLALSEAAASSAWQTRAGTSAADLLIGSAAKNDILLGYAGNDRLSGSYGHDVLIGGMGGDVQSGGAGHDSFVFTNAAESQRSLNGYDRITDFQPHFDTIDLSMIDANTKLAGNQTFALRSHFTHHAGELILRVIDDPGTKTDRNFVLADTNGDGSADFWLVLSGALALDRGDFLL